MFSDEFASSSSEGGGDRVKVVEEVATSQTEAESECESATNKSL